MSFQVGEFDFQIFDMPFLAFSKGALTGLVSEAGLTMKRGGKRTLLYFGLSVGLGRE